jgi:hypothetical protein
MGEGNKAATTAIQLILQGFPRPPTMGTPYTHDSLGFENDHQNGRAL